MATIAENLQTIIDIKADIKTAIENKGVTVGDSSFTDYPTLINNIPQENTGGNITLTNIDIITNGTYTAPDGEGYKTINVDVPTGGGTGSGLDFSLIGYDTELTKQIIDVYNADIAYSKQLLDEWDKETTSANSFYFENYQLKYAPYIDTSNVTDMNSMFYNCNSLEFTPIFNTSNVTDMNSMFCGCYSLKIFSLSDTSNVTDMNSMFGICQSLTTIPLFNTENVTTMNGMFSDCYSLTSVPQFDTGNVTDMSYMFNLCQLLTTIPLFNTENVTEMACMFADCYSLTSVPQFDTTNVTNMNNMFSRCQSLTTIPLFNTKNVTDMGYMFSECSLLTTIPEIKTGKVEYMDSCFLFCYSLTSLPKMDCTNVHYGGSPIGGGTLSNLTDLGGFENLKITWDWDFLDKTPNLTVESLMNVINNLWDWTDYPDGRVPNEYDDWYDYGTDHRLIFGQTNLDKLTAEQIAVATAKGWTLTA